MLCCISVSVRRLHKWSWHFYLRLWICSMLYCVRRTSPQKTVKIAFFPCRFSSLIILRLISASTKELFKSYLRLETTVFIRILRLTEISAYRISSNKRRTFGYSHRNKRFPLISASPLISAAPLNTGLIRIVTIFY